MGREGNDNPWLQISVSLHREIPLFLFKTFSHNTFNSISTKKLTTMRTITTLFTIALLLWGASAQPAILIVNNNANNPGNYTNLQDAIDAASPEDTILVSGSETYYAATTPGTYISINKPLTLIGAGYNPYTQYRLASKLYGITFTSDGENNPSESTIMGFYIEGNITVEGSDINYIQVYRNRIDGSISFYNNTYTGWNFWNIRNNIISTISQSTNTKSGLANSNIENNIINASIQYLNVASVIFSNNVFTRSTSWTDNFFASVKNCQFINNIFCGGCFDAQPTNCTFTNNIIYGYYGDGLSCTLNSCEGNIVDSDPAFVSVSNYWFNYSYDYHLDIGSPGLAAGTDDTDIGIYGGLYPFPGGELVPWQTSAMPTLPQIYKMNVLNPTLPIDGTLQVKIEATSQQ
jgi:hypothetical protein